MFSIDIVWHVVGLDGATACIVCSNWHFAVGSSFTLFYTGEDGGMVIAFEDCLEDGIEFMLVWHGGDF